jgi:hypothetical protein
MYKFHETIIEYICDECDELAPGRYVEDGDDDEIFLCLNCCKKFKRRPFIKSTREKPSEVRALIKILIKKEAKPCVVSQGTKRLAKKSRPKKS